MFNFNVRHIPGTKHIAADGFSRRPKTQSDNDDEEYEVDIDNFIDAEFFSISVCPISARRALKLDDIYSLRSQIITEWLATLRRPIRIKHITGKVWHAFKKEATRFRVIDGYFFRNNIKNVPLRRVIDSPEQQQEILKTLHDESGHKGIKDTYRRITNRYW